MSLQVRTALAEDARKEGILDMPETMFNYFIERVSLPSLSLPLSLKVK